jgi:CpXC protein
MSLPTSATISCPQCANSCRVMVWNTVNATNDPALRQRVLDHTINTITCANCKQKISVNTDLLYHDMDRKFLVWLVQPDRPGPFVLPDFAFKAAAKGWRSHRLRFVSSRDQLVEKIGIFEAGLSDFAIEALKLIAWSQKFPQKSITDDSMYFRAIHNEGSTDASVSFEVHEEGKFLARMDAPFQMYAAGMATPIGSPTYRLGEWIIVNQSNIGSF